MGNNYKTYYIPPNIKEWVDLKGKVKPILYENDELHLTNEGYKVLTFHIQKISYKSRGPIFPRFSLTPLSYSTHNEEAIGCLEHIF